MREADRIEVGAFGFTPRQALRRGLLSGEAFTAIVDDRPEAMFGIVIENAITGLARPWMLGTDAIYGRGREMLRMGREIVQRWVDSRLSLENLVSADNDRAIRLLKRWGFAVHSEVHMIGGIAFYCFGCE